jgi:hypothetical protein
VVIGTRTGRFGNHVPRPKWDVVENESQLSDSNRRPADYKSANPAVFSCL